MTTDNDIRIIDLLAGKNASTQRELAGAAGFSLGLTNSILKRLAKTGYIKMQNLDARKMRYILTPKGLAEKSRRSYDYIVNTISAFNSCLCRVKLILNAEIAAGARNFEIVGEGNIADLVELAVKELERTDITCSRREKSSSPRGAESRVLDCRLCAEENGGMGIFMLSRLLDGSLTRSEAIRSNEMAMLHARQPYHEL